MDNKMLNVTGLWSNESASGKKYISGNLGGLKILIFKNEQKQHDRSPDFFMKFAENKKKDAPTEDA